jgi:hypothetical protein
VSFPRIRKLSMTFTNNFVLNDKFSTVSSVDRLLYPVS